MEKNCKCNCSVSPFGLLSSLFDSVFSDTVFNDAFYEFEKAFTNEVKECNKANENIANWKESKDGNHYVLAINNPIAEIAVEDDERMLTFRYTKDDENYKQSITFPADALIETVKAKKGKEGKAVFVIVKKKVKEVEKLKGRQIEIQ